MRFFEKCFDTGQRKLPAHSICMAIYKTKQFRETCLPKLCSALISRYSYLTVNVSITGDDEKYPRVQPYKTGNITT
jgi:hypothetical protein